MNNIYFYVCFLACDFLLLVCLNLLLFQHQIQILSLSVCQKGLH